MRLTGQATEHFSKSVDAFDALRRYGWDDLFDAVVCMEDAALKPDPEVGGGGDSKA